MLAGWHRAKPKQRSTVTRTVLSSILTPTEEIGSAQSHAQYSAVETARDQAQAMSSGNILQQLYWLVVCGPPPPNKPGLSVSVVSGLPNKPGLSVLYLSHQTSLDCQCCIWATKQAWTVSVVSGPPNKPGLSVLNLGHQRSLDCQCCI